MGEVRYIRDLPDDVKRKIAGVLDACNPPNWRSLIKDVIRFHIPQYNEAFISKLAMETLLPGGSPTIKLLSDLGQRNRTVGELVNWITSMNGRTAGVQTILNVLSKFANFYDLY